MTWNGIANSGEILFSSPGDDGLFGFGTVEGDVNGVLGDTIVRGIAGFALPTGAPVVDQIIKFDGASWSYTADASGTALPIHALLGASHSDTETSAPVQGGLIVADGTSEWTQLTLGTAEFVLYSDGTDALYTRLGQNTPFEDGLVATPSITFTGDTNAGMFLGSSGIFSAAANSVSLLTMNGNNETLLLNAGQLVKTRAGAATTLLSSDYVYLVTTAGVTVTLPSAPLSNQVFVSKDRDGLASPVPGNRITISGNGNNIDGNAQIIIRLAYGSFTLLFNGTTWNII